MPGKDMTLTVRGTTILPSPGYTNVRLEPTRPGINPLILMLEVKADEPTGPQPEVMTPYDVEYKAPNTTIEYEEVTIQPDGVTVKVQHPR